MFKLNIITQLLIYLIFAISLNLWHLQYLLLLLMIMLYLLAGKKHRFYQLSKRLKWFYFFIFLIFVLNTPGEHITDQLLPLTPTYEGFITGVTQVLRISLMLAILSWLLAAHTRQKLIAAIYFLCSPLKCLGLNAERFAIRLWLTLHYVELDHETRRANLPLFSLKQRLEQIMGQAHDAPLSITLENEQLAWLDYAVIVLAVAGVALAFIKIQP